MSLPTYPFARERYWVDTAGGGPVAGNGAAAGAILHPLPRSKTSDLGEQRYSSTFTGEEFFLKDHQGAGRKALRAAAYPELAGGAGEKAARPSHETNLQVRSVASA